jgi:hypothetical protein
MMVVAINMILKILIKKLSAKEMHSTYTKFHLSMGFKLVFAMYINTGIIPLFVNFNVDQWFTSSGLSVDIFYNTLSIAFFTPLLYLCNTGHCYRVCMRNCEKLKG